MSDALIRQLREARQSWVEVEPGRRVQITRPPDASLHELTLRPGENNIECMLRCVCKYVVGWDGITEADLLGAAVGGSDAAQFSAALWADVVADRRHWITTVMAKLIAVINAHDAAKEAAAKN